MLYISTKPWATAVAMIARLAAALVATTTRLVAVMKTGRRFHSMEIWHDQGEAALPEVDTMITGWGDLDIA